MSDLVFRGGVIALAVGVTISAMVLSGTVSVSTGTLIGFILGGLVGIRS